MDPQSCLALPDFLSQGRSNRSQERPQCHSRRQVPKPPTIKLGVKAKRTSGEEKKQLCLRLGATSFLDYKSDDVETLVKGLTSGLGAHAVVCTASTEGAYSQSLRLLRRLGVLVCVGIPNVPFKLPITPYEMVVKGLFHTFHPSALFLSDLV